MIFRSSSEFCFGTRNKGSLSELEAQPQRRDKGKERQLLHHFLLLIISTAIDNVLAVDILREDISVVVGVVDVDRHLPRKIEPTVLVREVQVELVERRQ